jgi:hypothetical protein
VGPQISGTQAAVGESSVILRAEKNSNDRTSARAIIRSEIWIGSDYLPTLEEFAACFPPSMANVRKLNDTTFVLESPDFAKPDRQPTLYDDAEMMLERFVALMHVYAPGKIRNIWIQQIVQHFDNGDVASDSFDAYRKHYAHQSIDTVNRDLGAGVRVLGRAARLWRDDSTGLSWLAQQPLILLKKSPNKRHPYPLSHDEQRLLFKEKKPHLQLMAEFDVHTGLRDRA